MATRGEDAYPHLQHTELSQNDIEPLGAKTITQFAGRNAHQTQQEVKYTANGAYQQLEMLLANRSDLSVMSEVVKIRESLKIVAQQSEEFYERICRLCSAVNVDLSATELHGTYKSTSVNGIIKHNQQWAPMSLKRTSESTTESPISRKRKRATKAVPKEDTLATEAAAKVKPTDEVTDAEEIADAKEMTAQITSKLPAKPTTKKQTPRKPTKAAMAKLAAAATTDKVREEISAVSSSKESLEDNGPLSSSKMESATTETAKATPTEMEVPPLSKQSQIRVSRLASQSTTVSSSSSSNSAPKQDNAADAERSFATTNVECQNPSASKQIDPAKIMQTETSQPDVAHARQVPDVVESSQPEFDRLHASNHFKPMLPAAKEQIAMDSIPATQEPTRVEDSVVPAITKDGAEAPSLTSSSPPTAIAASIPVSKDIAAEPITHRTPIGNKIIDGPPPMSAKKKALLEAKAEKLQRAKERALRDKKMRRMSVK